MNEKCLGHYFILLNRGKLEEILKVLYFYSTSAFNIVFKNNAQKCSSVDFDEFWMSTMAVHIRKFGLSDGMGNNREQVDRF